MLAAAAIEAGGTQDQKAQFLPLIAAGKIATLSPPVPVRAPEMAITFDDSRIILSGKAGHIVDAADDGLCVLLASDHTGAAYRVILTADDRLSYDTKVMWDPGHRVASLTLDGLHLPRSRCFAASAHDEDRLLVRAALGLAAEAVGGSEALIALTIGYLGTRQQFGRPLGSFQALKHRIADHQTALVAARTLFRSATAKAASNSDDSAQEASAAKALACAVFANIARDSIQLHGGIGFTAEYACHLYLKRAHFIAHLFGDETLHTRRAASGLMIGEAA
jgi:alkylation response protein AidB-like acyl-CoA dehydrogenase